MLPLMTVSHMAAKRPAKTTYRVKPSRPLSAAEKMRAYRARKKKAGYKLAQIWVLDLNDPKIKKELQRQLKAIAKSSDEQESLAIIEAAADFSGWK